MVNPIARGCSTGDGPPSRLYLAQTGKRKQHRYPRSRSPEDYGSSCVSRNIMLDGKQMQIANQGAYR